MIDRYALHTITDQHRLAFDPAAYSRFKFGDGQAARSFGQTLAQGFITDYLPRLPQTAQLVVLPSPYSFIPTASYWMAQAFIRELNRALVEHGMDTADEVKITRSITYRDDYGSLTRDERMRLIGNDSFWVDPALLAEKTLLFIDDIRITGSHQFVIERMMKQYKLSNPCWFVYYAELANTDIHPNIENYLNYYTVKSLADLIPIVQSGHFRINTRVVKYILNHPPAGCAAFLEQQTSAFLADLYDMALGNRYHLIPEYVPAITCLKQYTIANQYQEA